MAIYQHGVYIQEIATSVQPSVDSPSCLPFVIGLTYDDGTNSNKPIVCNTWDEYVKTFAPIDTNRENITGNSTTFSSLDDFARVWFVKGGCGSAIFYNIAANQTTSEAVDVTSEMWVDSKTFVLPYVALSLSVTLDDVAESFTVRYSGNKTYITVAHTKDEGSYSVNVSYFDLSQVSLATLESGITAALSALDTIYSQLGMVPTVICAPYYWGAKNAEIIAKAEKFGGQYKAIAIFDIPAIQASTGNLVIYRDAQNVAYAEDADDAKAYGDELNNPYACSVWPLASYSGVTYSGAASACATMARTDQTIGGGDPFVSPSNQPVNGMTGAGINTLSNGVKAIWMTQEDVNDKLERFGIISFLHNTKGWCVWGDRTSCYPENTDPKDAFISCRRVFNDVANDFIMFAQSRIDMPLNKRQIEGITKAYTGKLNALVAKGAISAGRVELLPSENPTEALIDGLVAVHIYIAAPPPIRAITGITEYDVEAFIQSIA